MAPINFQQIYEDDLEDVTKESLKLPRHYNELTNESRRFVQDLISAGYSRALADALDPAILEETSALSQEMSNQLQGFSELVNSFLGSQNIEVED